MSSTLLDPVEARPAANTRRRSTAVAATAAQRLRTTMAAVRICFTWLGTRKTLTPEQKAQAAESFGAEGQFLSAGKKLLDTRHEAFRAVTAVRGKIQSYWKSISLPFPEPGIRLIRQAEIEVFDSRLGEFREELEEAVSKLERHYSELKAAAASQLGSLYNPDDYPERLASWFGVSWDYPSVEPPDYLQHLSPELFEQESARVAARFEEAVTLAEQAFLEEFSRLVTHLCERITGAENGEAKIFRDSAINNLVEFFGRFRQLNVRSSEELDRLVEEAQRVVRGVQPQMLRDNSSLRQQVSSQLGSVQTSLDDLLIDRPRRRILRNPAPGGRRDGPHHRARWISSVPL